VDGAARWTVEAAALHSKSTNSAWLGQTLQGRVTLTVAAGRIVFDDRA
jgi:dihydroorotase